MTQPQTKDRLTLPRAFEKGQTALVREMEDDGWTGRMSQNGHAIMRAPDGEATCSVTPKVGSFRGRGNQSAPYKRWKRCQGQQLAVAS